MPTKRFLEVQKVYTTLGLTSLSRVEVTFLLKRLERAETILEKLDKRGYTESTDFRDIKQYLKEGE